MMGDLEEDICLTVNGEYVVQFVECGKTIEMWTNFENVYKDLGIKKK